MADRTCTVEGCDSPHLARGLCQLHYHRARKTGDPGLAARNRRRAGSWGPCAAEGCERPARRNGLCSSCSAKARRAEAGSCTITGCTGRASARGLCGKHYEQVRRGVLAHPLAAEILLDAVCSVPDCGNRAHTKGFCIMHYARWRSTGDPGEAVARRVLRYDPDQRCAILTCERHVRANGYCATHHRRFTRFGITEDEISAILQRQKNRCAICKSRTPYGSGDWHIDHDHVTGQVRGLLCARCNSGIGMLQDDPKVLAAAARYISQHRQMQLFGPAGPVLKER